MTTVVTGLPPGSIKVATWAEIFGDPVAVAAMVDRLVHHAEVVVLQGDSYRLKDRGQEVIIRESN